MEARGQKGMTLVEMVVVLGIFTVVIGLVVAWAVLGLKVYQASNEQLLAEGRFNIAISKFIEEIREARNGEDGSYYLVSADSSSVEFFSDYDNDRLTEKVRYRLVGGDLFRSTIKPTINAPTYYSETNRQEVKVLEGITNNAKGQKTFLYYKGYPARVENELVAPVDLSRITLIRMVTWGKTPITNKDFLTGNFVRLRNYKALEGR